MKIYNENESIYNFLIAGVNNILYFKTRFYIFFLAFELKLNIIYFRGFSGEIIYYSFRVSEIIYSITNWGVLGKYTMC